MKEFFWLLGPPGSGKSTLMAELRPGGGVEHNIKVPWNAKNGRPYQKTISYIQYDDRTIEFGRMRDGYPGADALEKIGHAWYFQWFLDHPEFDVLLMEGKPDWFVDSSYELLRTADLDWHLYVLECPEAVCRVRMKLREARDRTMKPNNPQTTASRRTRAYQIAQKPEALLLDYKVAEQVLKEDQIIQNWISV